VAATAAECRFLDSLYLLKAFEAFQKFLIVAG